MSLDEVTTQADETSELDPALESDDESLGTVVVIDDEKSVVNLLRVILETDGYTVYEALTGQLGLGAVDAVSPDVVLLDVMMTERTEGFFTLERLKRDPELRHIPVLVVSSIYTEFPRFTVDPAAGWLPADGFLAKPIDPRVLLDEVTRVLAGAAGARAMGSTSS